MVVTCGGTEAMMAAMMTVCNPGDKVIVFSPFYENYGADAILSGAEPIYVPLVPPTFNYDSKVLEDAFRQHPKAIIVCNPSNPCGKVFTREELTEILGYAEKYDAFVITDEVYEHIVFPPYEHVAAASLPGGRSSGDDPQLALQDVFDHGLASRLPDCAAGTCRIWPRA